MSRRWNNLAMWAKYAADHRGYCLEFSRVGLFKAAREVIYDDTPIDLHAADIEDRLKREGRLTLRELIVGRKSRSEMVGVFLALLELIREKKILVQQEDDSIDITIDPAPEEHRRTYPQASLHLAEEESELQIHTDDTDEEAGETPVVPGGDTGETPVVR